MGCISSTTLYKGSLSLADVCLTPGSTQPLNISDPLLHHISAHQKDYLMSKKDICQVALKESANHQSGPSSCNLHFTNQTLSSYQRANIISIFCHHYQKPTYMTGGTKYGFPPYVS